MGRAVPGLAVVPSMKRLRLGRVIDRRCGGHLGEVLARVASR
jgi:hypothetical protein